MRVLLEQRVHSAGMPLRLVSIQVGVNPAVEVYAKSQKQVAQSLGIDYQSHTLDPHSSPEEFCAFVDRFNRDSSVHGIIVQLPLPAQLKCREVSRCFAPEKDCEGMHPDNLGRIVFGENSIVPCTAAAALELVLASGVDLAGKEAVVVGHSKIIGKPLALMLMDKLATVTVCHIGTFQAGKLEEHVRKADILVVAVGKPELIKGAWIKPGAVVIDVGINRVGGKLVGDVEFAEAAKRAAWITPVPGGVGPLTVMMLMRNLVEAAGLQKHS